MAQCPGSTQGVKALFPMEFDPEQGYYIAQTSSYRSGQGYAYSLQKRSVLVKTSAGWIVRAEYAIGSHGPPRTDPPIGPLLPPPFSTSPTQCFAHHLILPNRAGLLASPPRPPFPFSTTPPYHSSSSSSSLSDPIQPQTPNRNTQTCDPPWPFRAAYPSAHPRRPCTSRHHASANVRAHFMICEIHETTHCNSCITSIQEHLCNINKKHPPCALALLINAHNKNT